MGWTVRSRDEVGTDGPTFFLEVVPRGTREVRWRPPGGADRVLLEVLDRTVRTGKDETAPIPVL